MGLLESITHKEEIKNLLDEAKTQYAVAKNNFAEQKERTTQSLENLGKIKIDAWANDMDSFVSCFSSFNSIEVVQTIDTNMKFIGSDEEPQQMMINIKQASLTAGEVAKAGAAAVGTGALVGIASYGGAMMFANASTGTSIAALSGIAKTNATLSFFGGGAKAAGGLGIAGGQLVLAGIVVLPILAVGAIITSAKSKERLAEAKKIHAEAMNAVSQMDTMTTGMYGIEKMSDNYSSFIKRFGKKFKPFIREMKRIKAAHHVPKGGMIDFNELTVVEQKTLHLTWLMAQIYYQVLSATMLTADGKVSVEAGEILSAAENELKQFEKDTFIMKGEGSEAADILWISSARLMMIVNFIAMAAMIVAGVGIITTNIYLGFSLFIGAIIAFPIFFKFKNLAARKLWAWRIVRLVCALIFVIAMIIIL